MRRKIAVGVVAALSVMLLLGSSSAAWAFWTTTVTPGSSGTAAVASIQVGSTPTASANQGTVTVTWAASTLSNGLAVSGYVVTRSTSAGVVQTIGAACAGTVTALTCDEANVPAGDWIYTITPRFATNWSGPQSPPSAIITVV